MNHRNPTERLEDELDRAKGLGRWLSDDEQAFIKAKVWAGNETNAEFVCDFNCGFSLSLIHI